MKCLTPNVSFDLFMDNYFTSFRLFVCLPTLELTTLEREMCSTKIGSANTPSSGTNSCKKWNMTTLNSAAHIKQKRCVTYVAGQNGSKVLYIASSESCQPNRNLSGVGTKLKESLFKSNNQINSSVTTRTWVLSKEQIRTWPNTGLVTVCLNGRSCSSGCVGIVLTKIKATSLYLLWLFEEMLSIQFFWNIQRKANYPRAIQEFEISHQTFVIMTQNIVI